MKMYFVTTWSKEDTLLETFRITDVSKLLELVLEYQADGVKFDVWEAECIVDES